MRIALAPVDATEYEKLFQCADQALYTVKHKGPKRILLYEKSMKVRSPLCPPISVSKELFMSEEFQYQRRIFQILKNKIESGSFPKDALLPFVP